MILGLLLHGGRLRRIRRRCIQICFTKAGSWGVDISLLLFLLCFLLVFATVKIFEKCSKVRRVASDLRSTVFFLLA